MKTIFQLIYIAGLSSDVTGAYLLFRYGISPYIPKIPQQTFVTKAGAEYMAKDVAKFERLSKLGFKLIIAGFMCQLVQAIYTLFL